MRQFYCSRQLQETGKLFKGELNQIFITRYIRCFNVHMLPLQPLRTLIWFHFQISVVPLTSLLLLKFYAEEDNDVTQEAPNHFDIWKWNCQIFVAWVTYLTFPAEDAETFKQWLIFCGVSQDKKYNCLSLVMYLKIFSGQDDGLHCNFRNL